MVRVQIATCGKCDTEQVFNRPHGKPLPPEAIASKLRLVGWTVKRDGAVLRCAKCEGRTVPTNSEGEPLLATIHCGADGCARTIPIPRTGAAKGREVPASAVMSAMKGAGWLYAPAKGGEHGDAFCPFHAIGVKALGVMVDLRALGEHETRKRLRRDYHLTAEELDAALRDAESTARGSLGDETVDRAMANLAEELAALAAKQQEKEDAAMHDRMGAAADAPRQMTREHRRAIIEKLTAVYEEDGYGGDWSDAKVAQGLNVPVAWVAQLRAENFGDATESEADREQRKAMQREVNTLKTDLKAVRADIARALDAAAQADGKIPGIEARLAAAEAKLNARK